MALFHGPEKRLEIQLDERSQSLLDLSAPFWQTCVKAAGACVLERCSGNGVISFLLSESSLFIWQRRLVLLTCGTTSPLQALPCFLEQVAPDAVSFLRYEEKVLAGARMTSAAFQEVAGLAYDHFPDLIVGQQGEAGQDRILFVERGTSIAPATVQLLCHHLSAGAAARFSAPHRQGEQAAELLAGATSHQHWFTPQGYSENGLVGSNYYALHVTPQGDTSYAGFETDLAVDQYPKLIDRLLELFEPGRFSLFPPLQIAPDKNSICC